MNRFSLRCERDLLPDMISQDAVAARLEPAAARHAGAGDPQYRSGPRQLHRVSAVVASPGSTAQMSRWSSSVEQFALAQVHQHIDEEPSLTYGAFRRVCYGLGKHVQDSVDFVKLVRQPCRHSLPSIACQDEDADGHVDTDMFVEWFVNGSS